VACKGFLELEGKEIAAILKCLAITHSGDVKDYCRENIKNFEERIIVTQIWSDSV